MIEGLFCQTSQLLGTLRCRDEKSCFHRTGGCSELIFALFVLKSLHERLPRTKCVSKQLPKIGPSIFKLLEILHQHKNKRVQFGQRTVQFILIFHIRYEDSPKF